MARIRLQLGCIAQSRHPEQSLAMFWLGCIEYVLVRDRQSRHPEQSLAMFWLGHGGCIGPS